MDAGNMLEVRAAPRRVCEHNNQHCAPPQAWGEAPSAPFSPCGRRAGDEGEVNLQATLRAIASCSAGTSPKRSTRWQIWRSSACW